MSYQEIRKKLEYQVSEHAKKVRVEMDKCQPSKLEQKSDEFMAAFHRDMRKLYALHKSYVAGINDTLRIFSEDGSFDFNPIEPRYNHLMEVREKAIPKGKLSS